MYCVSRVSVKGMSFIWFLNFLLADSPKFIGEGNFVDSDNSWELFSRFQELFNLPITFPHSKH